MISLHGVRFLFFFFFSEEELEGQQLGGAGTAASGGQRSFPCSLPHPPDEVATPPSAEFAAFAWRNSSETLSEMSGSCVCDAIYVRVMRVISLELDSSDRQQGEN